jgi:6-pyruvoyltetrahydropterin/6-carboxytetrahydropterin synthase
MMSPHVTLTRRVTFSSGHRYWLKSLSPEENQARFGRWASPFNHGHNYVLYVSVAGGLIEENGMVVNIKTIDTILKEKILSQFDQQSINDEIEAFCDKAPCLENVLRYIRAELEPNLPENVTLTNLKLYETEDLYGELNPENDALTLTRSYEFAASHRLHADALSHEENVELFGKCNNPHGHGHNYVLEVTLGGRPSAETGMICKLDELDEIVEREVVDRYDHHNLNLEIEELKGKNPTSEVVAIEIFRRLKEKTPAELKRVRLFETARNVFEVNQGDV